MAAQIEIVIPEIGKLEELWKKAPQKVDDEISKALHKSALTVQRAAQEDTPVDTGRLRSSIQYRVMGKQARVYVQAKYGVFVHEGTRPHFPPIKAIEPWARKRGLNAFAVARAIARKGTKGHPFMRNAAEASKGDVSEFFREGIQNVIISLTR